MSDVKTLEFEHTDGRTQAAYEGSELAAVLDADPDWSLAEPAKKPAAKKPAAGE